jgi:hypothetical protein
MNVSFSAPPEKDRKQILNDVWRIVMQLEDPGEYIACAEVWIEYVMPTHLVCVCVCAWVWVCGLSHMAHQEWPHSGARLFFANQAMID